MRVLVTGGAGFIGSHVVDALLAEGHTVAALDNLSSGVRSNVAKAARLFVADVTDARTIDEAFAEFAPEAVYHYAAQVSVPKSFEEPRFDAEANILGLLNVLEASDRQRAAPRIVFASSGGAVYGDALELPSTENTRPNPATPYGIAKLAGEHYL